MSYTPFKEVTISNPGSSTRFGSDDLLDVMKILNAKVVSSRRPEIINPWRWSSWQELKQVTEASVTTPSESNVIHLFLSATDNKLKVKKTGGTIINLEDIGTGTWSNSSVETITNKTMNVDANTFKHSTTNAQGDVIFYDTTAGKYIRLAKGTANQSLTVNAAGTSLEWQTITGGGGGGESNTASNVGTAGIGIFHQKLGVDMQFKQLFSPDGSINISDDSGNEKIDFTLGATLVKTTQSNTYGDFQQTFRSSRLAITNPANTFSYFLVGSALTSSRNVFLPLLTGSDTFVTEAHTQTLTNKTLGSGTIANTNTITLKHSTTNSLGDILVNNGTKFDRRAKGSANQYLKVNSGATDVEWAGLTLDVDTETIKHSTTNSLGDILVGNGTKYNRRARGSANTYLRVNSGGTDLEWGSLPSTALDDLSDAVITTPSTNQVLQYNGSNWVNATLAAGAREELAAHFGMAATENLGSSMIDMLWVGVTGPGGFTDEGTKAIIPIDFTGKTQYKVSVALVIEGGSGSIDISIVDDATPTNVLHTFDEINQGTSISTLAALPGWATGVKTLRLRAGSGSGSDNVYLPSTSVYLK